MCQHIEHVVLLEQLKTQSSKHDKTILYNTDYSKPVLQVFISKYFRSSYRCSIKVKVFSISFRIFKLKRPAEEARLQVAAVFSYGKPW